MKEEIWKDVIGYEGKYLVSDMGRMSNGKYIMKNTISIYSRIGLYSNRKCYLALIHRVVAEAFIPNPNNYPCVNHINGIKQDNRVQNLEWCTYSHNLKHAYDTGLKEISTQRRLDISFNNRGEKAVGSKLKECDILAIRKLYNDGVKLQEIANVYSVTSANICSIGKNKNWKHIK